MKGIFEMHNTQESVFRMVEEDDVSFIRLQFTDLFGTLKNIAVTRSQLTRAFDGQFAFDGAMTPGFDDHDTMLTLVPDPDTFVIFPWRPQQGKVARLLCSVKTASGEPYPADTRQVLIRTIQKAKALGLSPMVDLRCEFFLFPTDENGKPDINGSEHAGYLDLGPQDSGENTRRDIVLTLEDLGIIVASSHHEAAPFQHAVTLQKMDMLSMADAMITFKLVVRTIAQRHGFFASFMPKPKSNMPGSGMHLGFSFDTSNGDYFDVRVFETGVSNHLQGLALVTNPLVNSYKRLMSCSGLQTVSPLSGEASWNLSDDLTAFEDGRIVLRHPDPAANPYLTMSLIMEAGLSGLTGTSPKTTDCIFPQNLNAAIGSFKADSLIQDVLGETISTRLIAAKEAEWADYSSQVTDWELSQWLFRA